MRSGKLAAHYQMKESEVASFKRDEEKIKIKRRRLICDIMGTIIMSQ